MNPDELAELDATELRALLVAAVDDVLRLCAAVLDGADDGGGESDAESLRYTWAWSTGDNTYSDGTVIVATATTRHLYAPPGRREEPTQ